MTYDKPVAIEKINEGEQWEPFANIHCRINKTKGSESANAGAQRFQATLTILEVDELDYIAYLQYRRDAFIYFLNQTENGQEYLDNAYRLEQTEPDREGLRKHNEFD